MGTILTLEKIGFAYGPLRVLRDVDLEIKPGEMIGILGPNGSGKSTLLKILDGILPVQEGSIRLYDQPLQRLKRSQIARQIAMVAQENHFRFSFSVLEVVLMGRFPHLKRLQFESQHDLAIARESLRATQAWELAYRPLHTLSGGEKQQVLIARALAQEPQLILLDEPSSFLDLKHKRALFQLIANLSREKGLGVVVVSHDLDLAAHYCQKLILLKQGTVYAQGAPAAVITKANIEAVYDCPVLIDQHPQTGRPRISLMD
jgi:iron complex transport system ATP-binding protein